MYKNNFKKQDWISSVWMKARTARNKNKNKIDLRKTVCSSTVGGGGGLMLVIEHKLMIQQHKAII